jgi:hypothetical protein
MRGHRVLGWTAAALVVVLACCGLPLAHSRWSESNERRKTDDEIAKYLSLVQRGDRVAADAMLCGGDDTSVVKLSGMNESAGAPRRIRSSSITSSWAWSSVTDGHGRTYRVGLTFTDGSTDTDDFVVEVIADEPCIATEFPS